MAIPTSDMPGHRALHERVFAALDSCIESQVVEFKESAPWDALEHKIIRTALAMANVRDGGILVIGASERGQAWELAGISDDHLATYDVDKIVDAVHRFASPPVVIEVVLVRYRNGQQFLAVQTREFNDLPVMCRRDGPPGSALKQGIMYVRPNGVARTSEVRSPEDLHGVLELAAEKRARRILETLRRFSGSEARPFDEELEGL